MDRAGKSTRLGAAAAADSTAGDLAPSRFGSRSCMLLSTSMSALAGYFCVAAQERFGPWPVLLSRFAVPLALLGAAMGPGLVRALQRPRPVHLLRAVFLLASQALFLACARRGGLFVAIVLFNTGPLFLVGIEAAHRRQALSWSAMGWSGVGFAGAWLVQGQHATPAASGLLPGLASGVCYALSQFTLFLASTEDRETTVLAQTFFWCSAMCLAPALVTMPRSLPAATGSTALALAWLFLGGLCSLGNQWFRTLAYRGSTRAAGLAPLLYFGVAVGMVLQSVHSGRLPAKPELLGAACIVGAALGVRRQPAVTNPRG